VSERERLCEGERIQEGLLGREGKRLRGKEREGKRERERERERGGHHRPAIRPYFHYHIDATSRKPELQFAVLACIFVQGPVLSPPLHLVLRPYHFNHLRPAGGIHGEWKRANSVQRPYRDDRDRVVPVLLPWFDKGEWKQLANTRRDRAGAKG
jgi:hypothetical protein